MPTFGPALVVLACACALWAVSGVSLRDIVLFVGYEAVFVLGPGWVVYGVLRPRAGRLERLAFGWGLGYVLEIGAFALTAALGARGLLIGYPLVPGVLALWLRIRAPRRAVPLQLDDARWVWAVAGIAALALVLVSAALFPAHPLPGTVPHVTYYIDMVFQVSIAAEALHHWPITDPVVSGEPLPYHTFVHMHMAAVSQITGISLPIVVFRLALLPMVGLFVFQTAVAGARLGGRRWIGPIAAGIVLLVSEFDLDPRNDPGWIPFLGTFFVGLWLSPTFVLGLVFFIPLVVLLIELVTESGRESSWRDWSLLALFMAGAAGAKVTILPVLVGGLALFLLARRRLDRRGLGALTLLCVVLGISFLAMYRGGDAGMRFHFPASIGYAVQLVQDQLSSLPHPLLTTVAVAVGLVGLFGAPLSGLVWFAKAPRKRLAPSHWLLLSLFAVSLGPYLFIDEPGFSQLFFTEYGFVAAVLASATGIYWFWTRSHVTDRRRRFLILGLAAAWPAALVIVVRLSLLVTSSDKVLYLLWYGLAVTVVVALSIAVVRAPRARRGFRVRLLLVGVLAAAALNVPLDVGPGLFNAWRGGSFYIRGTGLTRGLYQGLEWVRDETSPEAVIAVSNYGVDPTKQAPDDLNYSAFAERRTFLEGWLYAIKTLKLGPGAVVTGANMPYPERLRLNEAVFRRGDRGALRTLVRDYGVRYLLVDRVHGGTTKVVSPLGRQVFSNPDVAIYAVP